MDRRAVLAFVAGLPALLPSAAEACLIDPATPDYIERQNARVRRLFETWWARDLAGFRGLFENPLRDGGTPIDPAIVRSWGEEYSLPSAAQALFGRFFTDSRMSRRIDGLVNTQMGIIVFCVEWDEAERAVASCGGSGGTHLFHVGMSGINPKSVTHITSHWQGEDARIHVWSNYGR